MHRVKASSACNCSPLKALRLRSSIGFSFAYCFRFVSNMHRQICGKFSVCLLAYILVRCYTRRRIIEGKAKRCHPSRNIKVIIKKINPSFSCEYCVKDDMVVSSRRPSSSSSSSSLPFLLPLLRKDSQSYRRIRLQAPLLWKSGSGSGEKNARQEPVGRRRPTARVRKALGRGGARKGRSTKNETYSRNYGNA